MFTEIRDITALNKENVLALHIAANQQDFIETTQQCLDEAASDRRFIPVGLYREDTVVGFAMYGLFPHEDGSQRVWLDRFLIDERYQHKGLGKYFLQQLIDFLQATYNCEKIFLSVYDNNKVAIHLYQLFGFVFNGELDEKGEKVMVREVRTHDDH
ncbi:Spermine/spermidine acetyltransferase [Lysinibacillus sphaericus]|uniref:Spermine/spermidine acetyltransferase n=1 Tax=Lysinibacillus sphaericus TaxID=1421 RepID=A0A2S5CVA0_LYSSH|nr:GNAT family N-acetyltransferase [Lysinibacillus sphaericus]POZ54735.1 Spermine/spermidine acetyltransferase [Lysinibacillus sphaericus]